MFGHRYFGARFYGPRYFGPAEAAAGGADSPDDMAGKRILRVPVVVERKTEDDWLMEAAAILILEDL